MTRDVLNFGNIAVSIICHDAIAKESMFYLYRTRDKTQFLL